MASASFLFVLNILPFVLGSWTSPTLLMTFSHLPAIHSLYRFNRTSHLLLRETGASRYLYLAVSDHASVLHKTVFVDQNPFNAVLRGAGESLFLSLNTVAPGKNLSVNFTSSDDGGWTWTPPVRILPPGLKLLVDMLYVRETGRFFVIFKSHPGCELRMVSRPAGSTVFSAERLIQGTGDVDCGSLGAKAGYSFVGGRLWLHLAYIDGTTLRVMYTRSTDSGITWLPPREIAGSVYDILDLVTTGKSIFLSYIANDTMVAHMICSSDSGQKFSSPQVIAYRQADNNYAGLAVCVGSTSLESFYPMDESAPEYTLWNGSRKHPYDAIKGIMYTGVDCTVDSASGIRDTTAAVTAWDRDDEGFKLYFAVESEQMRIMRD